MVIDSIICEVSSWVLVKDKSKSYSLNDMVRDWRTCISGGLGHPPPILGEWNPPPMRKYKINFDGSSFGNPGPASYGCIMRDHGGAICLVRGVSLGHCNTIEAELIGLLISLKLLKDKGHYDCIVEGDSKSVVSWGKGESLGSWRLRHFIHEIKHLALMLKAFILHVTRAKNSLANRLAKWSVSRREEFYREVLPDC